MNVRIEGELVKVDATDVTRVDGALSVVVEGITSEVYELPDGSLTDGNSLVLSVEVESDRERIIRERFQARGLGGSSNGVAQSITIKAPMPGLVRSLLVKAGDAIKKNVVVLVLEAMKMENNILSPPRAIIGSNVCL
jgi:biotin carboxyl carrier protein